MSHACLGIGAFVHVSNVRLECVLNRIKATAAAALRLTSDVAPGRPFAQAGPTKIELALIDTYENPCPGEMVTVSGTTDLFLYTKSKNNGAIDFTLRVKHKGTGTAI